MLSLLFISLMSAAQPVAPTKPVVTPPTAPAKLAPPSPVPPVSMPMNPIPTPSAPVVAGVIAPPKPDANGFLCVKDLAEFEAVKKNFPRLFKQLPIAFAGDFSSHWPWNNYTAKEGLKIGFAGGKLKITVARTSPDGAEVMDGYATKFCVNTKANPGLFSVDLANKDAHGIGQYNGDFDADGITVGGRKLTAITNADFLALYREVRPPNSAAPGTPAGGTR